MEESEWQDYQRNHVNQAAFDSYGSDNIPYVYQISDPQTWNLYSYVGNNPLSYTDPNGMKRIKLGQRSNQAIEAAIKTTDKEIEAAKEAGDKEKVKALEEQKRDLTMELEGKK